MPKKFMKSFKYAGEGAKHTLQTQRNIWIHIFIGIVVVLAGALFRVSQAELAALVLTITLVIVAEMFNTALEELVNLIKPEYHPQAALVKNVAAAAVLVTALSSVVVGGLIFLPKIIIW